MKKLILILLLFTVVLLAAEPTGIVAHWKMNDNAATTTVIDSRNTNTGTFSDAGGDPSTAAHTTAGKTNSALTFDGTDDFVAVSDSASLDVTTITISAWINRDSGWALAGYVVAKMEDDSGGAAAEKQSYSVQIRTDGKISFTASLDGSGNLATTTSATLVPVSVWNHIAVTYNIDGTRKIYANGVSVSHSGSGGSGALNIGTARLVIGARHDVSSGSPKQFFKGNIDNVMIFNRALSSSDIKTLYNAGHGTEIVADLDSLQRGRKRRF